MEQEILRHKKINEVLVTVLIFNLLVAVAKIFCGFFINSSSMTADGFHSLSDGMSNIIGIIGMKFCLPNKDADHPYGHAKYETLFALGIAAMLLMVAINLVKQGIFHIFHPANTQVDTVSFFVMIFTIAVNFLVMVYEYKKGKMLKSEILVVDSMHTKSDIFISLAVIISLIGVKIGFKIIDPIVTFIIAGFISHTAFEIIKEKSGVLCDAVAIKDIDEIKKVVMCINGVCNCHNIRSRGSLDNIYLDLHVEIDGNIRFEDSHVMSHLIGKEIMKKFPNVVDVLVHMEPISK
jgi:cation diffusion facilitator family transporter